MTDLPLKDWILLGLFTIWLVVLSTCAIMAAWFKQDGPFAVWHAYLEARSDWWSRLLTCHVCLPYHLVVVLTLVFVVPGLLCPSILFWTYLPLVWLSMAALVHMVYGKGITDE